MARKKKDCEGRKRKRARERKRGREPVTDSTIITHAVCKGSYYGKKTQQVPKPVWRPPQAHLTPSRITNESCPLLIPFSCFLYIYFLYLIISKSTNNLCTYCNMLRHANLHVVKCRNIIKHISFECCFFLFCFFSVYASFREGLHASIER